MYIKVCEGDKSCVSSEEQKNTAVKSLFSQGQDFVFVFVQSLSKLEWRASKMCSPYYGILGRKKKSRIFYMKLISN